MIDDYLETGYYIYKSKDVLLLRQDIQKILTPLTLSLSRKYFLEQHQKIEAENADFELLFKSITLYEQELIKQNVECKRLSSILYELYPTLPGVLGLINHPLIISVLEKAGVRIAQACSTPIIRIDLPQDTIYSTPFHQDYWYSLLCESSVVVWFPILPLTRQQGYLRIIPNSHRNGFIPYVERTKGFNEPLEARDEHGNLDKKAIEVPIAEDEILIFSQLLLHASGFNQSDFARLTLQLRYNDLENMKVLGASFVPSDTLHVKKMRSLLIEKYNLEHERVS